MYERKKDVFTQALTMWPDLPGKAFFRTHEAILLGAADFQTPSLDLGCGNGDFVKLLRTSFTIGVDLSERSLSGAARSRSYRQVVRAPLSRLPFGAGVFASAVSNSTLEHVEDLDAVIAEVARVVRPGGLFHFTVPTPAKRALLHFSEFARQRDLPRLADRYDQAFDDFWGHRNYLTVTEWSSLLAGHGFELLNAQFYESAEASRLADLLSTVSLTTRSFDDAELDQLVQHAWREAWWGHLGGHLDPVPPGVGTSICCSARRQLA